jgi:hypothetical protein
MKKGMGILVFLLIFPILFACKKDKKDTTQQTKEETPLKTIIDRKSPADTIYQMNTAAATYGLKFHSTINGNITKLGCRMPAAGTYTVTLWDFTSHNQLAQAQVTTTSSSEFAYTSITPVPMSDLNTFVISVNSTSGGTAKAYYQLYKKPSPSIGIYPITAGNIVIDAPLYKAGTNAFPDYNNASDFPYLRGVADFVFVEGSL